MRRTPSFTLSLLALFITTMINSSASSGAVVELAIHNSAQPNQTAPATAAPTPAEEIIPIPVPRVPLILENRRTLHLDFSVQLNALYDTAALRLQRREINFIIANQFNNITLTNALILMPLLTKAPTSQILTETLTTTLNIGGRAQRQINQLTKVTPNYLYGDDLLELSIPQADTTNLTWKFSIDVDTYSTYVDDAELYTLTWPKKYPTDVIEGLKPQLYIESDRQIFQDAVTEVMGNELRLTAPYLVVKRLLHYCLKHSQVSGSTTLRGVAADGRSVDSIIGINVKGAVSMTEHQGLGTAPDLVCLCIATLRAAGIPARPVIGVEKKTGIKDRVVFIVWGEFYLNGCGWIPFDPELMRRSGVVSHSIQSKWKGLGSIKELNTRIPLGYYFQPPGRATIPFAPAVWGWLPSPHNKLQMPAIINAKLYTATQRGPRP
ncbi:MAG: transglutaminase-like domain-containing protein [Phycisphaerales bacterium]|nr:transglutaminase-like domain-containing protein [Phycisphaerales bacterium]